MALNPSNSSNLEELALKGLTLVQLLWEIQLPVNTDGVVKVHEYFKFIQEKVSLCVKSVTSVMKNALSIFLPPPFSLDASCARSVQGVSPDGRRPLNAWNQFFQSTTSFSESIRLVRGIFANAKN